MNLLTYGKKWIISPHHLHVYNVQLIDFTVNIILYTQSETNMYKFNFILRTCKIHLHPAN